MAKLSVVIPCFNEERTLQKCVEKVLEISDERLALEVIIVDDHPTDGCLSITEELRAEHKEITVVHHLQNKGKGAALRTGFRKATGDFVAVHAHFQYRTSYP